jgi:hypothetical protein
MRNKPCPSVQKRMYRVSVSPFTSEAEPLTLRSPVTVELNGPNQTREAAAGTDAPVPPNVHTVPGANALRVPCTEEPEPKVTLPPATNGEPYSNIKSLSVDVEDQNLDLPDVVTVDVAERMAADSDTEALDPTTRAPLSANEADEDTSTELLLTVRGDTALDGPVTLAMLKSLMPDSATPPGMLSEPLPRMLVFETAVLGARETEPAIGRRETTDCQSVEV